jgi:hypothetical protein
VVLAYLAILKTLGAQIDELRASMAEQFEAHPAGAIFTSLTANFVRCNPLRRLGGTCRSSRAERVSLSLR